MLEVLLTLLAAIALFYAALWAFQMRFIYFPRHYLFALERLPPPLQALRSSTRSGDQFSFYLPPRSGTRNRLWVIFGGNAMAALDWRDFALTHPDADAAFLLIEYPGYGYSRGLPSRESIAEASDAAFAALAVHLRVTPASLSQHSFVLGHSLGAATALEFACRNPPQGLVLTAPFSTLRDVASRLFGPPVRPLLRDNYDNIARLGELANRGFPAAILHGLDDDIVPFELGDRLARSAIWARFEPIPGARHNDLYEVAANEIKQAMLEVSGQVQREVTGRDI